MRLIDADALNKELKKRVGKPDTDRLYEVNLCIIDAPTIEAIPVEWLKKRMDQELDMSILYGGSYEEIAKSIWNVLYIWGGLMCNQFTKGGKEREREPGEDPRDGDQHESGLGGDRGADGPDGGGAAGHA